MIEDLTKRIDEMDKTIVALIRERYPEAQFLQQVPGVGPLISLTFVLTIGDPSRFGKSRQVGAYLGLVPRRRDSGDVSPQLGISKTGNTYLRQLLVNGSQYILGYRGADTDLRRWGCSTPRLAEGVVGSEQWLRLPGSSRSFSTAFG
jgi:transposase